MSHRFTFDWIERKMGGRGWKASDSKKAANKRKKKKFVIESK